MQKYYICLLIYIFIVKAVSAQVVTINTQQVPSTAAGDTRFFIEGGNTSVSKDDMVIRSNGNIGIGNTNPQHKLDIKGQLTYQDGSEYNDRILFSDARGIATWGQLSFAREIGIWTLKGTQYIGANPRGEYTLLTGAGGSSTLSSNEIGLSLTAGKNYELQIPEGEYLAILTGGFDINEYGHLTFGPGLSYYEDNVKNIVFYLSVTATENRTMTFEYEALNGNITTNSGASYYASPPYTSGYEFSITFLRLE